VDDTIVLPVIKLRNLDVIFDSSVFSRSGFDKVLEICSTLPFFARIHPPAFNKQNLHGITSFFSSIDKFSLLQSCLCGTVLQNPRC